MKKENKAIVIFMTIAGTVATLLSFLGLIPMD